MHSARGTKHTCSNDECGERFYDLNQSSPDCPYCGVAFNPAAIVAKHEFVMAAGKPTRGKVYKIAAAPVEEAEEATAEPATEIDVEDADDSADTPNILIEDDETEATTDDVIDKPHGEDEA
jgi:uncharacterized protein (TIGR02300 family)